MAKSVTIDELVHIGSRMAPATGPGSEAARLQALLDEWDDIYIRSGLSWKNLPASKDDKPTLLDAL